MAERRDYRKTGGEELALVRGRSAICKTYLRVLINLRKTFSLNCGEIR